MALAAVHVDHGFLEVAAPHGAGHGGRVADKPEVACARGGARLTGHVHGNVEVVGQDCRGTGATDRALEDVRHGLGDLGGEYLLRGVHVLVEDVAVTVLDAGDGHALAVHAVGSERRVGLGHLHGRDTHRAQGHGGIRRKVDVNAHGVSGGNDVLDAHGERHLRVRRVERFLGGEAQRHGAVARVAVVLHLPVVGDLQRRVGVEHDGGVHALVDGGGQGKHLHGRARLAACLRGCVELADVVVTAAHDGLDVAGGRVDGGQAKLQVGIAHHVELLGNGLLGVLLPRAVERGVDAQAALEDGVVVKLLEQQRLHVVREVRILAHRVRIGAVVEPQLLRHGLVVLLLRDVAGGEHTVKHDVAAPHGEVGVDGGVVSGGRLRKAAQKRCLGKRQVACVLVEVVDARCLDAVGTVAEVDGVEVHHEDLVLGVHLLHLDGDVGLAHLTLERVVKLLVRQDGVAHQLLRDGGGTLGAARELRDDGAHDALRVDAVVLVETDVLGVDGCRQDIRGDLVHVDDATVLQVVLRDDGAIGRVNGGGLRHEVCVCRLVVGQVLEPAVDHHGKRDEQCGHEQCHEADEAGNGECDHVRA